MIVEKTGTRLSTTISNWNKVRYHLKNIQRDASWRLGGNPVFSKKRTGARILVYHGICQSDPLRFNTLFVRVADFESQLKLYKKYFNLISLDDFYNERFCNDRFNLCLTFDDGFANNYKYVLPLLEQYEVPAAFFITTIRDSGFDILWNDVLSIAYKFGPPAFEFRNKKYTRNAAGKYISAEGIYFADILRAGNFEMKAAMIKMFGHLKDRVDEDYWLQMTEAQIAELSTSKWVSIGSHGYYHSDMAKLETTAAEKELISSRRFLENITGKAIRALAFPYGSYSTPVVELCKKLGYSQLLATDFINPGDGRDGTMRERFTVNPFISNINQAHANIFGSYR